MAADVNSLIGRGMKFPFTTTRNRGVESSELIDRINQSLWVIFDTPKGDRLMLPAFGSIINQFKFEPHDAILYDRLREAIHDAVTEWEPRITITSIDFLASPEDIDEHRLYIKLNYHIINTEIDGNFVYPYMRETYDSLSSR